MRKVTLQGEAMGGPWFAVIITTDEYDTNLITKTIQQELDLIEALMSPYNKNSEISLLNRSNTNEWQSVSPHLFKVIKDGLQIGRETNGTLDITLGALVEKWGFGPASPPDKLRSQDQEAEAMRHSGLGLIKIKQDRIYKSGAVQFDLCALAKGHAADAVAQSLRGMSIDNFLINIAGDLFASGMPLEDKLWRVGVELPLPDKQITFQRLNISNLALASSGTYRNVHEIEGVKFNHLLDPKSGEPIEFGLMSVTVCANTCIRADALATALAVMGPELGPKFANDANVDAIFCVAVADGFKEIGTGCIEQYLS